MGIDVFVNNAGILHNGWTQEEWDATMATNVYGAAAVWAQRLGAMLLLTGVSEMICSPMQDRSSSRRRCCPRSVTAAGW